MPSGPAYVVLPIRPSTSPGGGLLAEHLHKVGTILAGVMPDNGRGEIQDAVEFNSQKAEASLSLIEDKLRRVLQTAHVVVLDMWFDATKMGPARVRAMVGEAILRTCSAAARRTGNHALSETHQVLILCENKLQKSDPLIKAVRQADPSGCIAVVDGSQQRVVEPTWDLPDEVLGLAQLTDDDLRRDIRSRLIRRRGVFASARDDGSYHPFHFTPERCLPRITELLRRQVDHQAPSAVLYDEIANPWLEEVVLAVCANHTPAARFSDLDLMPEDVQNLRDSRDDVQETRKRKAVWRALRRRRPPPHLLLVVPLFMSGERVSEAISKLTGTFAGSTTVLAIMIDENRLNDQGGCSYRSMDVDYQVTVTQHLFGDDDWRLVAAQVSGCYEKLDARWSRPSLIGFWSLITEVGSEVETPVPPTPLGRRAHKLYPRFKDMPDDDALWLAECILRVAERQLRIKRAQMLVVLPAETEDTGARPLGLAIDKRLDVEVLWVPRKEITARTASDNTRERLREYRGSAIVIVDESSVSHGTVTDLVHIAREEAKSKPKLAVVGAELPTDSVTERPAILRSLFGWHPT